MSMNGISNTFIPNTLSGLEAFNATNITINGVDISSLFVPFVNSPSDVDLADKNLTTSGRIQTAILKLPSVTYGATRVLQVDVNKEVQSIELNGVYVTYTGSTANLDMGTNAVKSSYVPIANEDMVNKRYADITLLSQTDAASTYLSQANAAVIYVPYNGASANLNLGSFRAYTTAVPVASNELVNKQYTDATFPDFSYLSSTYLTLTGATATYLSITNAASTYLTQTSAATTYLSITNAASTYLTQTSAATTYVPYSGATGNVDVGTHALRTIYTPSVPNDVINKQYSDTTLLSQATAGTTYLTQANAALIYLTQSVAASTYFPQSSIVFYAPLASPTFTGVPAAPTASPGTNTTQIATTAFVTAAVSGAGVSSFSAGSTGFTPSTATTGAITLAGTLNVANGGTGVTTSTGSGSVVLSASPTLTGTPLAPTATAGTNTTQIATTAFVTNAVSGAGVSSFSGGTTGLLPSTATTGAIVLTGTLAVANGGTGNTTGTLAYLGNTQTFTGINTFSDQMTLTKGFDLTLGTVNSFIVRNSSLVTQFSVVNTGVTMGNLVLTGNVLNMSSTSPNAFYSGDNLLISASATVGKTILMTVAGTSFTLDQYGASLGSNTKTLYCNLFEALSFLGIDMVGYQDSFFKIGNTLNISSQPVGWDFQTKFGSFPNYTTHARISGLGVGTNALYSFASNNLNITCASTINYGATTAHSFSVNSVGNFAVSGDGLWMPVDSSKSFYITDNYPKNATTTYGRYFGVGNKIYQDFGNEFQWRRDPGLTGTAVATLMQLNSDGLTLSNAVGAGNPQIVFAGSGTPIFRCNGVGLNWFVNSGDQLGFFDLHAGHWRIGTAGGKKLILCAGTANTLQIGTGTSGQYPVEIYGYQVITGAYWYYLGGANWVAAGTLTIAVGLYVQYAISADGGYILASDERIKKNIKPAESGSLAVIKTIPIKSYEHIDPFVHGCATAFNVTAQDLKNTYPEAVTNSSGYIPDMYVKCQWIHVDDKQIEINIPKPHTVIIGDKVKLILEDSTHREAKVTAIKDDNTFAVEKWDEFKMEVSDELFVYGKHTDDFLRVDKIKLGVLALAGVKELNQIVETQHLQIQAQQAKIEEQSLAINTLTESMKFLTEHLSKLTNAFNDIVKEK